MDPVRLDHKLPHDLIIEILSRLPVRTLLRFRCVSRPWQALIDDRDFAAFHLSRYNSIPAVAESRLLIVQKRNPYTSNCVVVRTATFQSVESPSIQRQRGVVSDWDIVGSENGLLMVRQKSSTRRLMIWNPSTRRSQPLPPAPAIPKPLLHYDDLGLGFDPVSNDYRHVRFVRNFDRFAVYSLATDSWKTIGFDPWTETPVSSFAIIPIRQRSVCFRGVLYILACVSSARPLNVVSFTLATDRCLVWAWRVGNKYHVDWGRTEQALALADGGATLATFYLWPAGGSMWVLDDVSEVDGMRYVPRHQFVFGWEVPRMEFVYVTRKDEMVVRDSGRVVAFNLPVFERRWLTEALWPRCKAWRYMENLMRF